MKRWIRRKRNTLGYGVQSPSDFYFVRHVLRERSPYYAYTELHDAVAKMGAERRVYDEERCRLLFRLADYVHPEVILQVGSTSALATYSMTLACPTARCITIDTEKSDGNEMELLVQTIQETGRVELLHVTHGSRYEAVVETALPHVCNKTLFIIDGIRESKEKHAWWECLKLSPLTGVSYDLKTVGLLFFDKTRYKNAYWINMRGK